MVEFIRARLDNITEEDEIYLHIALCSAIRRFRDIDSPGAKEDVIAIEKLRQKIFLGASEVI